MAYGVYGTVYGLRVYDVRRAMAIAGSPSSVIFFSFLTIGGVCNLILFFLSFWASQGIYGVQGTCLTARWARWLHRTVHAWPHRTASATVQRNFLLFSSFFLCVRSPTVRTRTTIFFFVFLFFVFLTIISSRGFEVGRPSLLMILF